MCFPESAALCDRGYGIPVERVFNPVPYDREFFSDFLFRQRIDQQGCRFRLRIFGQPVTQFSGDRPQVAVAQCRYCTKLTFRLSLQPAQKRFRACLRYNNGTIEIPPGTAYAPGGTGRIDI